jgi:hypothetical protein
MLMDVKKDRDFEEIDFLSGFYSGTKPKKSVGKFKGNKLMWM